MKQAWWHEVGLRRNKCLKMKTLPRNTIPQQVDSTLTFIEKETVMPPTKTPCGDLFFKLIFDCASFL